jgi:hypothetical protein
MTQLVGACVFVEVYKPIEKYLSATVSVFFSAYYRKEELDLSCYFFPSLEF